MQKLLSDFPLTLRIGIDTGGIIRENNDLFGETVNNAAYLTSIAKGEKILLSKNTFNSLNLNAQESCHEYDNIILKGHTLKTKIFRLHWEQKTHETFSDVTVHMGIQNSTKTGKLNKLILIYNNQELIIPSNFGTFTIGRNTGVSSLFIKNEFASRDHCQIIYRRGKFIL